MNKKKMVEQDAAKTYNQFKVFEGRKYTGMKVGGRHKWYYDKGEWNEKEVTPDRWKFSFAVAKRRAGHAPPGSGVPIGTEYHWYILAHQNVRKLDENTYSTALTGLKCKLAHKRAGKDTWSASEQAQRRNLIKILQEMISDLSAETPAVESPVRRPAAAKVHSRLRKPNQDSGRDQLVGAPRVKVHRLEGVWLPTEDAGAANLKWSVQSTHTAGQRCGSDAARISKDQEERFRTERGSD